MDKGQYNGILNKINDTIQSIKETTGKTYCNKKNSDETLKRQVENNLDTNSIDQKTKQFADFFNGEIVNLE